MNTINTAHTQYCNRPQDERFPSLEALIAHATEEKRLAVERPYNLKDLRAVAVGEGLVLESPRGQAGLSNWAWGQLNRTIGAPAGYVGSLSPELAARCVNEGIDKTPAGTTVNLLVRGQNGQPPMIRACTSETYGRVWEADLYSEANRLVFSGQSNGRDWKLPTAWDGKPAGAYLNDRNSFVIMIDGGSIVTDPSARFGSDGQMYRGIMIRNSEVGASGIVIECVLFRFICGNLMLWGATIDRAFRRRHVGKHVLREVIRELATIARRWTDRPASQDEHIIRALIDRQLASTDKGLIDELRAIGATKEQAESALARVRDTESVNPLSYWGIAQGLTRESQNAEHREDRYELDKLAGLVLARGAKLVAA